APTGEPRLVLGRGQQTEGPDPHGDDRGQGRLAVVADQADVLISRGSGDQPRGSEARGQLKGSRRMLAVEASDESASRRCRPGMSRPEHRGEYYRGPLPRLSPGDGDERERRARRQSADRDREPAGGWRESQRGDREQGCATENRDLPAAKSAHDAPA